MKTKIAIAIVALGATLIIPILIACIYLFMVSCEKEKDTHHINVNDSLSVNFGTSFGECYSYCRHEIELSDTIANITISSWYSDKYPTKHYTKYITTAKWDSVVNEIRKINFAKLDTFYGCPDCCDGGAGWIIVKTKNDQHKVMFDLMIDEPAELKTLWKMLGNLNNSLKTKD